MTGGMTVTAKGYFQQILGTHKNLGTHDQDKISKSAKPRWPVTGVENCGDQQLQEAKIGFMRKT